MELYLVDRIVCRTTGSILLCGEERSLCAQPDDPWRGPLEPSVVLFNEYVKIFSINQN